MDLTSTRITLVWQDRNRLLSSGRDTVGREVVKIFENIGVEVDWVDGTSPETESVVSIRVVLAGDPIRLEGLIQTTALNPQIDVHRHGP
jgi:hypothetical protein